MAGWQKDFEKWQYAKAPVDADEVSAIIERVFTGRIKIGTGSSHLYKIQVPELIDHPDYKFGLISVPLKGGQKVKAPYLHLLYNAAILLELYSPIGSKDDDEQDDH